MLYKLNSKYNMEYKRICPICKKELEYKSYSAWYNANKSNSICRSCAAKQKAREVLDILKEFSKCSLHKAFFLYEALSLCSNQGQAREQK